MPQTPRTTNDVIIQSMRLIGELTPNEIPSADQLNQGLYCLNDLLDSLSTAGIYIPFVRELSFNLIPNQSDYTVSTAIANPDVEFEQIVEVDLCNIIYLTTSYPLRVISLPERYLSMTQTNLTVRPQTVTLIRSNLYSLLRFYPIPDKQYECQIRGKFMLDELELFDNLEEVPRSYYSFLRYALAREFLNIYPSANWSAQAEDKYKSMYQTMLPANDIDVAIRPDGLLMTRYGYGIDNSWGGNW
jgi:hypothetical protein